MVIQYGRIYLHRRASIPGYFTIAALPILPRDSSEPVARQIRYRCISAKLKIAFFLICIFI